MIVSIFICLYFFRISPKNLTFEKKKKQTDWKDVFEFIKMLQGK